MSQPLPQHIVVQVSPQRWCVAERTAIDGTVFRIVTEKIPTAWQAAEVRADLDNVDERDWSPFTKSVME